MGTIANMPTIVSSAAKTALGALAFSLHGRTPAFAYRHMLQLFYRTGGISNDAMSTMLRLTKRPYKLPDNNGVLGNFLDEDVRTIGDNLRARGYHVFEQRLPDDLCEKLLEFAITRPCVQLNKDGQTSGEVELPRFPRENPEAVRYDLPEQLSIEEPLIQGLMADRSIISVAQNYLECRPILDIVAMWWNAASAQPDKVAAQYWHFDMDRIKWLKFFVYLTDVGPNNGPHSFVAGSHRTGGIASALLQKGYARLTDEEVTGEYSADKFVEFTAPRGTVIAEDTRGLHKGKHVIEGDRLMLQLQFSNSLFGGEYPKRKIGRVDNPALAEMISAYPRLYSNYV
jgi:Phytanoyl-CoA dioxygenase (PhyH)